MKPWAQFIVCLLLSAGIWLIHNLSQEYVGVVSRSVVAVSNIDGRATRSMTEVAIPAQIRASGFHHLAFTRKNAKPKDVFFAASDFKHVSGDVYRITAASLSKYINEIFGDGVVVESFVPVDPEFSFAEENHKVVPVRLVSEISFAPEYMATKHISFQPDSVIVYGESARLENIEYVPSRPIERTDLKTSIHGSVELDAPKGVRISRDEVLYSLEVSRYVEVRSEVKIATKNVPVNARLSVLPSTATVVFRCLFPTGTNPSTKTEFYIDYNDFSKSLTGRCLPKCDRIPSNVIDYYVVPEYFDCMLNSSR